MSEDKKNWQKIFPKKILIQEEIDWCERFYGTTLFEPLYTESVTDGMSFIEMIEKNHNWLDDHINDAKSSSDRMKRALPYYNK